MIRNSLLAIACTLLLPFTMSHDASARGDVVLLDPMPPGVAFETLAVGESQKFRFHVDAMFLHRIDVGCGAVSGKIAGIEQITYVEYGEVDVHDWDTNEIIDTLKAGESYGPVSEDAGAFYLASPKGKQATVYHFSAGASGRVGTSLPRGDLGLESRGCGAAANQTETSSTLAAVTTIWSRDTVPHGSAPTGPSLVYVGLLTVAPGAALGRAYEETPQGQTVTMSGSGVMLLQSGAFGNGSTGQSGSTAGPEVAPGQTPWMYEGGVMALENFGATPSVALVFGAVPIDVPILTLQ